MSNPYEQFAAPSNPYEQFAVEKKKIGVEGLGDAVKDIAGDFHPLTQLAVGAKSAWDLAAMRLKQLTPGAGPLTSQQESEVMANRALLEASPMALAGNIGGSILATGGPVASLYRGATNLASRVLPAFLAPAVGAGVVGGTTNTLLNPVLANESEAKNTGSGALVAVLADTAVRGGARVVQPIVQSPAVQRLLNYDVVPTLGSAAGGLLKKVEDSLTSLPLVGDIIKRRQLGSREELNAAGLRIATPKGQEITAVGKEGIEQGKDAFNRAYGQVYKGNEIGLDNILVQDLRAAKNAPTIPMSRDEISKYDAIIKREIFDRLPRGTTVPTDEAKVVIEKNLGAAVSKAEGPLQDALKAARDSFRSAMGRSVGPAGAAELKGIDKSYSAFMDMKKAAERAEGSGGVATPRQIQKAAKPNSELKKLGDAAQSVLPPSIPNSGTADRALLNWMLLSGGAMGANQFASGEGPVVNPGYLAALALAPALYSRAGSRFMVGDLIPGQPALAQALRDTAPYAAQAGALYR